MGFQFNISKDINKKEKPKEQQFDLKKEIQKDVSLEDSDQNRAEYILQKFHNEIEKLPARDNLKRLLKKIIVGLFLGEKIEQEIIFLNDVKNLLDKVREDKTDPYYTDLLDILNEIYLLAIDRQNENNFEAEPNDKKAQEILKALQNSEAYRPYYYFYDQYDEMGYYQNDFYDHDDTYMYQDDRNTEVSSSMQNSQYLNNTFQYSDQQQQQQQQQQQYQRYPSDYYGPVSPTSNRSNDPYFQQQDDEEEEENESNQQDYLNDYLQSEQQQQRNQLGIMREIARSSQSNRTYNSYYQDVRQQQQSDNENFGVPFSHINNRIYYLGARINTLNLGINTLQNYNSRQEYNSYYNDDDYGDDYRYHTHMYHQDQEESNEQYYSGQFFRNNRSENAIIDNDNNNNNEEYENNDGQIDNDNENEQQSENGLYNDSNQLLTIPEEEEEEQEDEQQQQKLQDMQVDQEQTDLINLLNDNLVESSTNNHNNQNEKQITQIQENVHSSQNVG